jgi:SAM-dependent methyltransferase
MTTSNYLKNVREQYEEYPYPARNPEDEKTRLIPTGLEFLDYLNFKCFKGAQGFSRFRALVAGGGTGDAAIFLGEQLRDRDAEVVYLDISSASRRIAEERARVRGLNNITWIQGSILDLPELDIGEFDYINCSGVLHHLESPEAGLRALRSVLRDDGCIGLLLYAQIGRTAIYQMQDLLRRINVGEPSTQGKIDNARAVMAQLPASNWFKLSEKLLPAEHINHGDAGIYDMFLHEQDRAYTVDELFEYIESCGLNFVDFSYQRAWRYRPESYIQDQRLLHKIKQLDVRKQYAIAELLAGNILLHQCYVSNRRNTVAKLHDLDNIPFFFLYHLDGASLCQEMQKSPGRDVILCPTPDTKLSVTPGRYTHLFFKHIDGKRNLRKIFRKIKKDLGKSNVSDADLLHDFEPVFRLLNEADWLLLRGPSSRPVSDLHELQDRVAQRHRASTQP